MKATLITNVALPLLFLTPSNAFSPSKLNRRYNRGPLVTPTNDSRFLTKSQNFNGVTLILLAAKVGIFFGTSTGNTLTVAEKIAQAFGDDAEGPFDIDEVQGGIAKTFGKYDALVVGTPTWNTGADSERSGTGWDEVYYGEMQGNDSSDFQHYTSTKLTNNR